MRRQFRLVLDQISCDGHGVCAELLPELIELGSSEAVVPEVEGAFAVGEAALRGLGFNDEDIGEVIGTERASLIATSHHHHTIAMKGRTA